MISQACVKCGASLPPAVVPASVPSLVDGVPPSPVRMWCPCGQAYDARLGVFAVADRPTWPFHSVRVWWWIEVKGPTDFPADVLDPSGLPRGGQ